MTILAEFYRETADFGIVVGKMVSPDYEDMDGYGIINKRTGVREQETNAEAMAVRLLYRSQALLTEVLNDPEDKLGKAAKQMELDRLRDSEYFGVE